MIPRGVARVALLALAPLLLARGAHGDDVEAARQAYDRGAAAFDRGAYAEAAVEFAHADELGPNPVALESALKAAALADDPVLGMALVERADQRPPNERVAAAVRKARDKFETRAGRLVVRCREGQACTAKIGGEPIAPGTRRWVRAGDQAVEIEAGGQTESFTVRVEGGASVDWQPRSRVTVPPTATTGVTASPAPAPSTSEHAPPRGTPPDGGGLAPAWFFVAAGATAVLGGVSIWSGVDTLDKHDAYMNGDDSAEAPGKNAQTRTNLLLGVTGAAAIGTALLGILAVDWRGSGKESARVSTAIGPGSGSVTVRF